MLSLTPKRVFKTVHDFLLICYRSIRAIRAVFSSRFVVCFKRSFIGLFSVQKLPHYGRHSTANHYTYWHKIGHVENCFNKKHADFRVLLFTAVAVVVRIRLIWWSFKSTSNRTNINDFENYTKINCECNSKQTAQLFGHSTVRPAFFFASISFIHSSDISYGIIQQNNIVPDWMFIMRNRLNDE